MNIKRIVHMLCAAMFVVSIAFGMASCKPETCEHQWSDATCTAPKTCSLCSATEGKALGHNYGDWAVKTEATCSAAGVKASVCANCKDEKTDAIPAEGHIAANIVKVDAAAATHTENGVIDCYTCVDCNKYFEDAAATEEISAEAAIILAQGHVRAEKHDAVPATHTTNGTMEYYYCATCDANFTDRSPEADEIPDAELVILAMGHDRAEKVAANTAPTHTRDGVKVESYYCDVCKAYFTGRAPEAEKITANNLVPALGHGGATKVNAKEPTHTANGNWEYWHCDTCNADFAGTEADAELLSDEAIVILASGHIRAEKHDAVPATHTTNGTMEYYYCATCEANFTDRSPEADVILPGEEVLFATGHTRAEKVAANTPATHTRDGVLVDSYYCDVCEAYFTGRAPDAAAITADNLISALGHIRAEKHDAVPATHTTAGTIEYYYCETCDANFTDRSPQADEILKGEEIIPAQGHVRAQKRDAVPATHTVNGTIEYYYCATCDANFEGRSPEAEEIPDAELVVLAMGHERAEKVAANTPATHTRPGVKVESYYCEVCEAYFTSRAPEATRIADDYLILSLGHEGATKIEAKQATHTVNGNYEYYYCTACDKYFADNTYDAEEVTVEEMTILAQGHVLAVKHDAVPATHTTNGTIEYYYCATCDANFTDMSPEAEVIPAGEEVVLSLGHERAEKVAANTPATHTRDGVKVESYYCEVCEAYFASKAPDAAAITADNLISALGHEGATKVEAKQATHTENGNWEYYYCSVCDKYFVGNTYDAEEVTVEDMTIFAMGHGRDLEKVEAKAATATEDGNIEYWYCSTCDKNYNGKAPGATELSDEDVTIPATGSN